MSAPFILLTDRQPINRLFPAEWGTLHVEDKTIRMEDGALWSKRGLSWFLGFHRFQQGENILPDIKWFLQNGVNSPRLFGPLPWVELHGQYDYGNFNFSKLDSFQGLLAEHGIRPNWSILPGSPDPRAKSFLNQFYEVLGARWNSIVEIVNEPDHGDKIDPLEILKGVNTRGILTAYGYYPEEKGRAINNCPVRDWLSVHLPRDDQWARKARDAEFLQKAYGKPTSSDEPAKIAEPDFHGAGVKNNWETTPREAGWHFGVCHLWTHGATIHTQHGRNGLVPEPGTLTQTAVDYVRENVWKRIPADVQTGNYMGSHFNTSPVDGAVTSDGKPVWTYSSVKDHEAYAIRCYPSAPNGINGWTVKDRWGQYGEFVRLER